MSWCLGGMLAGLLFCITVLPAMAAQTGEVEFELAQTAAKDGRYRDVIDILSELLRNPELGSGGQVVAYSNRGIAYSLLNAYGLAKQDLEDAYRLDPQHLLTLNHLGILAAQVDENPTAAIDYFGLASSIGFAPSQVALADILLQGQRVAKDERYAFSLYKQAAEANYSLAFNGLGELLMRGVGTTRDSSQAVVWFKRAAAAGVVEANYQLGRAYDEGTSISVDAKEAVAQYLVAARQGHAAAQNALGYMYRLGRGVPQSYIKAAQWYRLAADQGAAPAQNRLAWLLAGCPVKEICDGGAAVLWAQKAVQQDSRAGYLDSLASGYARKGDFETAISTLEQVLKTVGPSDGDRASYERRLRLYRRGESYQL
jgi:TPR repeat protein